MQVFLVALIGLVLRVDPSTLNREGSFDREFYGDVMFVLLVGTVCPAVAALYYKTPVERAAAFLQGVVESRVQAAAAKKTDSKPSKVRRASMAQTRVAQSPQAPAKGKKGTSKKAQTADPQPNETSPLKKRAMTTTTGNRAASNDIDLESLPSAASRAGALTPLPPPALSSEEATQDNASSLLPPKSKQAEQAEQSDPKLGSGVAAP
jgi:hypothetical protein